MSSTILLSILVVGGLAPSPDTGAEAGLVELEAAEAEVVDCVDAESRTRKRGSSYDHVVHLDNRCDEAVQCRVSTNVDPDPIKAGVPKGGEANVVVREGSSVKAFEARAICRTLGS